MQRPNRNRPLFRFIIPANFDELDPRYQLAITIRYLNEFIKFFGRNFPKFSWLLRILAIIILLLIITICLRIFNYFAKFLAVIVLKIFYLFDHQSISDAIPDMAIIFDKFMAIYLFINFIIDFF